MPLIAKDTGRFCEIDWHRGQRIYECPLCQCEICEMCARPHERGDCQPENWEGWDPDPNEGDR